MANLNIRFYSNCLKRTTSFNVYLPNDERWDAKDDGNEYRKRKTKTLFLLHGYTGDAGNWVPEWLSDKYNFAVVIPNGENSFWLDGMSTGHEFCKFLGVELIGFVRKTFGLATERDDTCIMGLSMGGFGAMHTALAYPEVFGKAACLSSAFIHNEVAKMKPGEGNDVANYDYYRECFGEPEKLPESVNNPEFLVKQLKAEGKRIPELFLACGRDDFLIEPNRAMDKFLTELGVEHVYEEDEGVHDMVFWSKYVERFVPRIFG